MRYRMNMVVLVVATVAIVAMPVAAQAPAQKPSFEAVTVKPAPYGQSVKQLIAYAYRVRDFQIVGGPDWAETERWDIQGKADEDDAAPPPTDPTQPDPFALLAQSILEDHFRLQMHREVRKLPVYELVVASGGPKIRLSDDQTPIDLRATPPSVPNGFDRVRRGQYYISGNRAGMGFEGNAIPLKQLVIILTHETRRTVIDKTGLQGLYDMQIEWTPNSPRIPLTTAIEEELGLQLVPSTAPVEVLVIDSVHKPSEN